MRTRNGLLLTMALCLAALPAAGQTPQTIFVGPTGSDTSTCGAQASPCLTLQFAYDERANAGDEIRVLTGTYNECVFAFPISGTKPVRFVAQDWVTSQNNQTTIIDGTGLCNLSGGEAATIDLRGNGAALQGFTIRGGGLSGVAAFGGVAITNNLITGNGANSSANGPDGGGIFLYTDTCGYGNVTATIADNQVTLNSAVRDGGGVFVFAQAFNQDLGGAEPCALAGNSQVTVERNTISVNDSDGFAGGLGVFTFSEAGRSADVIVTQNVIQGNTLFATGGGYGYGGGIWASTFGFGSETIDIRDNTVVGNVSSGDGGGVSAWVDALVDADHRIDVVANTVQNNVADGNGGGLDLLVNATDLEATAAVSLSAVGNTVQGNIAAEFGAGIVGGGGGILSSFFAARSCDSSLASCPAPASMRMHLVGNRITDNETEVSGGGVTLYASSDADADTMQGIPASPASAAIQFSNNTVARNSATNGFATGIGGGVFALLQSFGDATSTANVELNTIAENASDTGGGGVHVETFTGRDTNGPMINGRGILRVNRSIIAANSGFGVGAQLPGAPGVIGASGDNRLTTTVSSSDLFGNPDGNFQTTLSDTPHVFNMSGILTLDPMLDADGPDDTVDTDDDYTSGLCQRFGRTFPGSLPDVNGDDMTDGIDILRIAVAFGSSTITGRYSALADVDGSGMVDGNDLAFAVAAIGDTCP